MHASFGILVDDGPQNISFPILPFLFGGLSSRMKPTHNERGFPNYTPRLWNNVNEGAKIFGLCWVTHPCGENDPGRFTADVNDRLWLVRIERIHNPI
jgi:hypothetical protein